MGSDGLITTRTEPNSSFWMDKPGIWCFCQDTVGTASVLPQSQPLPQWGGFILQQTWFWSALPCPCSVRPLFTRRHASRQCPCCVDVPLPPEVPGPARLPVAAASVWRPVQHLSLWVRGRAILRQTGALLPLTPESQRCLSMGWRGPSPLTQELYLCTQNQ